MKKKTILDNMLDSWRHIPYTWKHYLAFMKTQKKLLGRHEYFFHDWDKLVMYIFLGFLGTSEINRLHRSWNFHHPGNRSGYIDWTEAIIDWECAGLTKPDKPYNARETMKRLYPGYEAEIEPFLKELGL